AIIFAQWASLLLELGDMERIIEKSSEWETSKKDPIYADGIYFWRGLAQSILTNFPPAISDFETLIKNYPETEYLEEGSLRRGIALFYDNQLLEAQEALYAFLEDFPSSNALDQAHYFLGDIEGYAEEYELAIDHFQKSIELTNTIQIVESATFRLGEIYERLERYDDMIAVFQGFIEENPASIVVTDAILQLGRAYEFTRNPNGMLELYRNSIAKEYKNPGNLGIDALIEAYTEKYDRNKTILLETVALLDRLDEDLEFRTKFVTDRGFLFEQFYNNKDLEQSLYNRLRAHKSFSEQLLDDLSPIADITTVYREQLAQYPSQTPEEYFKSLLKTAQAENDRIGEIRMLMGLYRSGLKVEPKEPFTREDLNTASPRVLLYIADLARENDQIEFAVEAWEAVLERFANDDAGIVAYLRLADYNEQIGELETALTKLEAIEKLYPGSPQLPAVILRQGELLTKLGKTDAARKRYQYILKVPDWRGVAHARALLQTGDAYVADKAYDKAHGFYERTFLTYPQFGEWSARAYLADAKVLLKLGSKEDAVTTLQEAVDRLAEAAPVEVFEEIQTKLRDLQS
ncbi:MAG: tetratricopeptide repeat protein, partial [Verrucomicrobiota bacterium]